MSGLVWKSGTREKNESCSRTATVIHVDRDQAGEDHRSEGSSAPAPGEDLDDVDSVEVGVGAQVGLPCLPPCSDDRGLRHFADGDVRRGKREVERLAAPAGGDHDLALMNMFGRAGGS